MPDHDISIKSVQNSDNTDERLKAIASFFGFSFEQVESINSDLIKHLNDKLLQFNELKSENLQITVSFDELKTNSSKKIDNLKKEMENLIKQNDGIRKERDDTCDKLESEKNEKTKISNELESIKRRADDLIEEKKELQCNQQRTLKILDERLKELCLLYTSRCV